MFIGGITALLLQSLHPLAMAAVAGHSGYRGDPWGRLQRTSYFLAVTTFGRDGDAQEAIARVRAIHRRVTGIAPDGRPYAASDPHLLTWVHIAEADSFLRAHARFGTRPLDQAGRDGYVADLARIGEALGVPDPPRTEAELAAATARHPPRPGRAAPPARSLSPGASGCCPVRPRGAGRGRRFRPARAGPGARSTCPACRSPRSRWSARPATPWCTPSAGPPPRRARPRPADAGPTPPPRSARDCRWRNAGAWSSPGRTPASRASA